MAKVNTIRNIFAALTKFLFSLLLLPMAFGLGSAFFMLFSSPTSMSASEIFFVFGYFIFLILFLLNVLPGYIYVLGHESTHAIWAVLFRGKIKEFNVSSKGGNVVATKVNFFVTLAPYFFPFYTFLIILLYYCLAFFFDIAQWVNWLFFLVGFTYSFHVFLTVDAIIEGQPDIKKTGYLFSFVLIIALNFAIAALMLKFIVPEKVSMKEYLLNSYNAAAAIYGYIFRGFREILDRTI